MNNSEWRAIPTEYGGVRFKSRFEANTAYLLDALGYEWEYEPRSFLLEDGRHYMPDFWVPRIRLWLESRGYNSEQSWDQIEAFSRAVFYGQVRPDGTLREPSDDIPWRESVDYLSVGETWNHLTEYQHRPASHGPVLGP